MSTTRKNYDFIIIGGGTAGLPVAGRLSEDPNVSVLVLEAGENALQDPRVAIPGMYTAAFGTDLDWNFMTEPQENLNGRQVTHPQGRALGGSSAINAEVLVPPSASGFDAWESFGNPGWSWKGVEPYFRKFYTITEPDEALAKHLDVTWIDKSDEKPSGPVQASFTATVEEPFPKACSETMKNLGFGLTGDPFSGRVIGGWNIPAAVDPVSKTRSYAATAYYHPISSRSNLEVLTGIAVTRILLEENPIGDNVIARGVVFNTKDGQEQQVKATCEVILAAGVFQSPKILELSGIGEKALLEKHGIKTRVENPNVGENLQDHMLVTANFEAAEGVATRDAILRREPKVIEAITQMYQEHKTGPFASGTLSSIAFIPVMSQLLEKLELQLQAGLEKAIQQSAKSPSMSEFDKLRFDFLKSNLQSFSTEDASAMLLFSPHQYNGPKQTGVAGNPMPGSFICLGISPLHPFSRGTSHISSPDPSAPPAIDPRYLSHPLDIEVFARHLMSVEIVAKSPPLVNYLKPGVRTPQPVEGRLDTLEKAKEYIRERASSYFHPVGTCAMLPREKGGVVDARLRVYGVEGLRIVDSSIMPMIPRANTQTSVYAIAEKAADLIKEDYGRKQYGL